jgi:integrase
VKLTQKAVGALVLPAGKTEAIVFDDDLGGFGIRIRRGGARTWIYQYKLGSQHRRITLGSAAALSAVRARETAADLHAQVRLGRDPSGEKTESRARAAETVGATVQAYLDHKRKSLRPRSYTETERHLLKGCKPLHGLPLAKVDRRAVASRIAAIAARNGDVTANRTRASLAAFFAWCMREGLLDSNPVIGTNRQPEKSRERVLGDDELKMIWNALGSDDYSVIVKLLMTTGQRGDEIAALRWSEIVGDEIKLSGARTKNGRPHDIPLAPSVHALLEGRERGDEFVFGRRQGRPFRGWGVCKEALDQRIRDSGIKLEHWTHHDLRRTMATRLAETGTAPHIIEAILNHVSGHKAGVHGIYNRANYEPQKRIALQKWADHVEALVSGKRKSSVVELRRG